MGETFPKLILFPFQTAKPTILPTNLNGMNVAAYFLLTLCRIIFSSVVLRDFLASRSGSGHCRRALCLSNMCRNTNVDKICNCVTGTSCNLKIGVDLAPGKSYGLGILQTVNSIEINKDVSSAYLSFNNTAVIITNLS